MEWREKMSDLLTPTEAAKFLHVRPQTLACWRLYGKGPSFARIGRMIRYRREELERWIAAQTVPVGEPGR